MKANVPTMIQRMEHQKDRGFVCNIDTLTSYQEIVAGTRMIPENCDKVQIPRSVFVALVQGEELIAAEEQGRLAVLPCKIGDNIFWCSTYLSDGEPFEIKSAIVTSFYVTNDCTVYIYVGLEDDIDAELIGSIGFNEDFGTCVSITPEGVKDLYDNLGSDSKEAVAHV